MREDYVAYEYLSVNVKSDLEPMYIDCFEHFGWIPVNNSGKRDYYINSNPYQYIVNIKFKRNKKVKSKEELRILQDKCEKVFFTIDKLENLPHSIATMYSLVVGIISLFILLISVFYLINLNTICFFAILGCIIGIIGIILPYFIYEKTKYKKEIEIKVKIEECQQIIDDTCLKARSILFKDE